MFFTVLTIYILGFLSVPISVRLFKIANLFDEELHEELDIDIILVASIVWPVYWLFLVVLKLKIIVVQIVKRLAGLSD